MVRFKVIHASKLLLILSILFLAVALSLLAIRLFTGEQESAPIGSANLVKEFEDKEAKASMVFASADRSAETPFYETEGIEIEILGRAEENGLSRRVLIYHTHTHEAYEQVSEDPYESLEAWRTTDADHSVVRVGEALTLALRNYGFEVIHDTTDHERDDLSTAYTRSIKTLEGYAEPFDLYIDLHRDAYVKGQEISTTLSDGTPSAQLMMLIGNGNGFEVKPYYNQNLAFAFALEARINAIEPGLCKPVLVKDGRYNQHIGIFSILIEVGHNRNTLKEALSAVSPLAQAIYSLLIDQPDAKLEGFRREFARSENGTPENVT